MADPQQIYALINEIFLIVNDGDRQLFGRFQLTPTRFYALVHLGERPGISVSELSGLMLCDKSNMTRILKAMEAEGLVNRKPHESDGRTLRLYLSEEGERLRQKAAACHLEYNQRRFDRPRPNGNDELFRSLDALKGQLRASLETHDVTVVS
jgi:DNA-binding MarR family transcriptional regulator